MSLSSRWPDFRSGATYQDRHRLTARQTAAVWAGWLGTRIRWDAFVSLTFDPARAFGVSQARASREAFRWCNETARTLRQPIGWIYAPERGPNGGQWHVHVLIVGAVAEALSGAPAAAWRTRNGRIDIRSVWESCGATLYTTKTAAATGEVVWSDTLKPYVLGAPGAQNVRLHP